MTICKMLSSMFFIFFAMVPLSSFAQIADSANLRVQYHKLLTDLPKNIIVDHPTMAGHSPIAIKYQIKQIYGDDPVVGNSFDGTLSTPFYERFILTDDSSVTFEGGTRPVYCLWISGLDNRRTPPPKDSAIFHPLPLVLTKVYWIFDKTDCKGPIAADGQTAWYSFVEVDNLDPKTLQFQTGQLIYFGEGFGLKSPMQPMQGLSTFL